MKTLIEQTVDTKTTTTLHLKSKDIREMLAKAGHKVPKDAYIHIMVPGGSDWSNTDLGIDECEGNLMVQYTESTRTTTEDKK